jgi:uncharacterized protein (DUF1330 family)
MVFTRLRTKDQAEMDNYGQKAGGSAAGHPVQLLAAYGPQEVLEGDDHEGMVILSFPDRDAAKAWYNSPAYQDARKHRLAGADYQVTVVDSV